MPSSPTLPGLAGALRPSGTDPVICAHLHTAMFQFRYARRERPVNPGNVNTARPCCAVTVGNKAVFPHTPLCGKVDAPRTYPRDSPGAKISKIVAVQVACDHRDEHYPPPGQKMQVSRLCTWSSSCHPCTFHLSACDPQYNATPGSLAQTCACRNAAFAPNGARVRPGTPFAMRAGNVRIPAFPNLENPKDVADCT